MYDDSELLSMRFPQKLWRIVSDCKSGAICWGISDNTILLDYRKFQDEYLHTRNSIFKTNNITSFIRQLNLYGFRKVTSHVRDSTCNSRDPEVHEFLHEYFQANRMDLLNKVRRRSASGKIKSSQQSQSKTCNCDPIDESFPQMTRLQMCQWALKLALQQATQEYHQEKFWQTVMDDDRLAYKINSYDVLPMRRLLLDVLYMDVDIVHCNLQFHAI